MKFNKIQVKLIEYMGSDQLIIDDARKSFNAEESEWRTEKNELGIEKDVSLMRFMKWWDHGVPFEAPVFKFALKIPIFVARQLVKYRMSSWNELSRRYVGSELEFFDFELREKDTSTTKQGSGKPLNNSYFPDNQKLCKVGEVFNKVDEYYTFFIKENTSKISDNRVSPETARVIQPMGSMTDVRWQMNLTELFHIFGQRLDPHAQKETRHTVQLMRETMEDKFPVAMKAWEDKWRIMKVFKKIGYEYYKRFKIDEFIEKLEGLEYNE